ncbi:MAG: glutamate formimidoyltransferase [Acidobacteria bacterium]|nr:glutamate formimidoyltransferase [Acidobacteriota bacterium]
MTCSDTPILECIPNFSEGRDSAVVDEIVGAIASVPGVLLLRRESDGDHNRSVVTFAGPPAAVVDAAVAGASAAVARIDLNRHTGAHPRMGAVDVVPFVPIRGLTMSDAVVYAREAAERIWRELALPVYLYEESATRGSHVNLADLRRGQFEGIREAIATDPVRTPDIGGPAVHPTAGIVAVGARKPLVAWNVLLATTDVSIAKSIAREVRGSSGGMPTVKALGFAIPSKGCVQVSMNLTDYTTTPMHAAFEAVRAAAGRLGVEILGTELIGLVPQDAIAATAEYYLKIGEFSIERVLEPRIERVDRSTRSGTGSEG